MNVTSTLHSETSSDLMFVVMLISSITINLCIQQRVSVEHFASNDNNKTEEGFGIKGLLILLKDADLSARQKVEANSFWQASPVSLDSEAVCCMLDLDQDHKLTRLPTQVLKLIIQKFMCCWLICWLDKLLQ